MAKDMRPQRVAIRSRLSIEILLYVAKTRQRAFGSIAPIFSALSPPLSPISLYPYLSCISPRPMTAPALACPIGCRARSGSPAMAKPRDKTRRKKT